MKIRVLLLALASAVLLAGCVSTAGYGYRGDGYYHGGSTIEYRYGRGYPYGYYDDYYRYGYPYGYGSDYGYRYGYPYRYSRHHYGYPRHYYPRPPYNGHGGGHHGKPPTSRPPSSGGPPWRNLDRLGPPAHGRQIPAPGAAPRNVTPRATVTPPRRPATVSPPRMAPPPSTAPPRVSPAIRTERTSGKAARYKREVD